MTGGWVFALAAALLVFGVVLLLRSWWPGRSGLTRHCRRCGYNVDAIQSERCPECGSPLTPTGVVQGQRHRRPRVALLSMVFLVIGLAIGAMLAEHRWLGKIDWYYYRPFSWLLRDVNSTDRWVATRGWEELLRRDQTGALSDAQFQSMVDRALVEQAAPASGPMTQPMMEFLDRIAFRGRLSEQQRLRFITSANLASLTVQPPASPDKPYTFRIMRIGRGGDLSWLQNWRVFVTVDGYPSPKISAEGTAWGISGPYYQDRLPPLSPGKHQIRATIDASVGSDEVHLFADEEHQPPVQTLTVNVDVPAAATQPALTAGSPSR
jgi:hypothetical protein